ncbi:MAG: hypothetical protein RLY21_18 [Planctomycetota bacterium]|jgi:hypothetical protein
MPSVSYDSLSFFHDGARSGVRRFAIVGAAFDPALMTADGWAGELARLRHAGFNTVVARVPWALHEPTPDRFDFAGDRDLRRFVHEAGSAGLKVILRIGPCVGGTFAGGGMPGWIGGFAGDRLRESSPAFMQRVTSFWRRLTREFVDLQATRNGGSAERPIVAIGLEDHWHSLDAEVGAAYFGELVRFVREFGVEVPLISANNCWYMHEGVVDTWCRESDRPAERMAELRQVQPDAPPMGILSWDEDAQRLASRAIVRSDFVLEASGGRHRGATSARGFAERPPRDLFDLRRALVFASSFGEVLAKLSADEVAARVEMRARGDGGVDFFGRNLALNGARFERCTGSLVALSGDLLVVAGKPRGKIEITVDGSTATLTVPVEGGTPKCVSVRRLRVVAVPFSLADGVGIAGDGFEFVDREGNLVVAIDAAGGVRRLKPDAAAKAPPRRARRLGETTALVERASLDGTHARFAWIAAPASLGAFGVVAQTAYYRARFKQTGKAKRLYALPSARALDATLVIDGARHANGGAGVVEIASSGAHTIVMEVASDGLPAIGRAVGAPTGVFGPLVELAPIKGVKRDAVPQPPRDATVVGRFIWGLDLVDEVGAKTMRWTFAPQKQDVVVCIPPRAADAMVAGDHGFRLNGELLPCIGPAGSASFVVLPAAKLAPMRPKQLKKGEKPPKARNAVLEPGDNELVYDGVPHADAKDIRIFAVKGAIAADWAFARVDPPASWAAATSVAKTALGRKTGVPTWFRTDFHLEAPCALSLRATFAGDARATVMVNGASALVHEGASGVASGKGAARKLVRTADVPASTTRTGVNEILVFSPDGRMPELTVL